MTLKKIALTFFVFALVLSPCVQSAYAQEPAQVTKDIEPMRGAPQSFADLSEKLLPAVVNVSSTQAIPDQQEMAQQYPQFPEGSPFNDFFEDFFGEQMPQFRRGFPQQALPSASLGSGFVIDGKKGYIITNAHVVADADKVRITFSDDHTVDAEIIGSDEKTDLALLKVDTEGKEIPSLKFGDSEKMRVGDWVLAIGNPFGLGGTVTAGIISARQRNINAGPYDDFIQTDASINRGNSGGPMFNLEGEVIGINTAIFSPSGGSVGIGFAIPSDLAVPVIKQLAKYGQTRRGWLGVRIQSVTEEIAGSLGLDRPRGALVASVNSKGPAEDAKLETGDIILSFNGQKIDSVRELPRVVAETEIGATVPLTFWRNEKEMRTKVKVGELEKAEESGIINENRPVQNTENTETDNNAGITFGNAPDLGDAVIITSLDPNSEAAEKGLLPGDIVLEINQKAPKSPSDAVKIMKDAKKQGKDFILFRVKQDNTSGVRFVALKLK